MIIYPYYALFQALVMPPLGAFYYFYLWYKRGSMKPPGRYRIRVHRERVDPILWQAPVTDVKTLLSRLMVARVRGEPTGPHVAQLGASLRAERLVRR